MTQGDFPILFEEWCGFFEVPCIGLVDSRRLFRSTPESSHLRTEATCMQEMKCSTCSAWVRSPARNWTQAANTLPISHMGTHGFFSLPGDSGINIKGKITETNVYVFFSFHRSYRSPYLIWYEHHPVAALMASCTPVYYLHTYHYSVDHSCFMQ